MKFIGNILWLAFGGLEASIGYFTGSIALAITIIGLPWAWQTCKVGLLCLWPFGATVNKSHEGFGCMSLLMNIIWIIFGGLLSWCLHIFFGLLLAITIVGLPFAKQHFKLAGLCLAPFGKDITLDI